MGDNIPPLLGAFILLALGGDAVRAIMLMSIELLSLQACGHGERGPDQHFQMLFKFKNGNSLFNEENPFNQNI